MRKLKHLLKYTNSLLLLILFTDTANGHQAFFWALCDAVYWVWLVHSHYHWGTHRVQAGPTTNQEEIQDEVLAPYKSGTYSERTL